MSAMSDTYLASAAQSRREAEASTLSNVRERCMRSAAAWQAMGERQKQIETLRDERIAAQPPVLAAQLVAQGAVS